MTLKSHVSIWKTLAQHLDTHNKSLETVERRKGEGVVFFNKTLPALGKDLERGLTGTFVLSSATPFTAKRGSALPAFLYEHFILVFHKDGSIRDYPVGIPGLRSLLMTFYKFETPLDPLQEQDAYQKFEDVDGLVKTTNFPYGLEEVRKNFLSLLPDDPMDIRPHHASGATADRVTNSGKRHVRRYIPSLMKVYGPTYFFNSRVHAQNWASVNDTVIHTAKSRVSLVPKDSRGPRIICIEPHECMYIQKGLMSKLYWFTENMSPARGYINFTDQSINQDLARAASIDCSLATIDLKDASDLVGWNLIQHLVSPEWYRSLKACRSPIAQLPYGTVELKKFAPMGSALCFPIEAFLFWSIAKTVAPEVWVYGDDIIVGIEYSNAVIKALESYGLIVNRDKTLTSGFFRESCGGEYYRGEDISYVKCKSYDQEKFIAFCNNITERFSLDLSEKLISWYESTHNVIIYREALEFAKAPRPFVFYTDRYISTSVFFKHRWNEDLQQPEVLRLEHVLDLNGVRKREVIPHCKIDDDLLFDWYTLSESSTEPLAESFADAYAGLSSLRPRSYTNIMPLDNRKIAHRDTLPEPKYVWGVFLDNNTRSKLLS